MSLSKLVVQQDYFASRIPYASQAHGSFEAHMSFPLRMRASLKVK